VIIIKTLHEKKGGDILSLSVPLTADDYRMGLRAELTKHSVTRQILLFLIFLPSHDFSLNIQIFFLGPKITIVTFWTLVNF